ncbi:hypothetical protein TNCV_2816431 [Trichonephila clavipes]|nr:hypothetical protein TNCV_2816431 [Trichonephila clavipes]
MTAVIELSGQRAKGQSSFRGLVNLSPNSLKTHDVASFMLVKTLESSRSCGGEIRQVGYQLRYRARLSSVVQHYEVRSPCTFSKYDINKHSCSGFYSTELKI